MRIAFVMPAYNEQELLPASIDGALPLVDRLVVVDDGSQDDTAAIADQYRSRFPEQIDVIHQTNQGVGRAVVAGIRFLLECTDVDAVGIMAGDNQCEPGLIPVFRHILANHPDLDISKGSRFLHPATLGRMPRFRYWGNRGVSLAMQLILGYAGMSDVLHGYLLARRWVFERMDLGSIAAGYDLENTMMAELRRLECHVALVPSPSRYGRERSKIVLSRQIPHTLRLMLAIWARRMTTGKLTDRISPLLLATGNLPGAYVAMRLTSPEVTVFSETGVPRRT